MQEALDAEGAVTPQELLGTNRVDVCIVGGGLTGLWTALHVKQSHPEIEVGLLEGSLCGVGASGANGGFAMTWWPKFKTLKALFGTDEAVRLARASEQSVAETGAFCATHGIDVDFLRAGWLWAATNPSQVDSWDETIGVLERAGAAPFERLSPARVLEVSGSDGHLGGVFEAGVATVQPALLTRGLRRVASSLGVHVWEHSPMTSFESSPSGVTLHSRQGVVVADRAVLATNAWLAKYARIRRHLLVLGSDVIATAPVPGLIADSDSEWKKGAAVSDSRRLVHYYRTTRDGRIVFGKGGGRISFRGHLDLVGWSASTRSDDLRSHMGRIYPGLAKVPITDSWAGAVDYSSDGLPFAGYLDKHRRVSYAAGFSGNGVGPSHLLGKVLAGMATDGTDEWATSPLIRSPGTYLPPEPFRYVGGHVVRSALQHKEASEDKGLRPARAATLLAGLDPTSFVG